MTVRELEGYEEMLDKLLGSLPPERLLARVAPEQRLAASPVLRHSRLYGGYWRGWRPSSGWPG